MSRLKIFLLIAIVIIIIGFVLPQQPAIPVKNADTNDWNHQTFWHYPWGTSVVHKGIDIFAPVNTPVISSVYGVVIYAGKFGIGGNSVAILGPKWRIHYYAHLKEVKTSFGKLVSTKETIGSIGKTGNAFNRPAHLHYTILTFFPHIWRWDSSRQGWKKMFCLNPTEILLNKQ